MEVVEGFTVNGNRGEEVGTCNPEDAVQHVDSDQPAAAADLRLRMRSGDGGRSNNLGDGDPPAAKETPHHLVWGSLNKAKDASPILFRIGFTMWNYHLQTITWR